MSFVLERRLIIVTRLERISWVLVQHNLAETSLSLLHFFFKLCFITVFF